MSVKQYLMIPVGIKHMTSAFTAQGVAALYMKDAYPIVQETFTCMTAEEAKHITITFKMVEKLN